MSPKSILSIFFIMFAAFSIEFADILNRLPTSNSHDARLVSVSSCLKKEHFDIFSFRKRDLNEKLFFQLKSSLVSDEEQLFYS